MCAINLPRKIIAFISLLLCLLIAVSSFSTASFPKHADPTCAGNIAARTARRKKRGRNSSLHSSELNDDSSSQLSSSRRGFIASCVAASCIACGALPASPSNSTITPTDGDADANIVETNSVVDSIGSDSQQSLPPIGRDNEPITAFQESISGFVSGSAVSIVKTIVKYPLDTVTVRLQMPNTRYAWSDPTALFTGTFDGMTAPLISNIPSAGVFFAIKDATRSALTGYEVLGGLPKWALTALAVGAATPPYWMLRNPSEVIKTRLQVGAEGYYEGMSTVDAFRLAVGADGGRGDNSTMMDGVAELYSGYGENVLYAYPADIIKFAAYEYLTGLGGKGTKRNAVSPVDGAFYGALSTAISQFATTPLDVLRNRIMAEVASVVDDEDGPSAIARPSYVDRMTGIAKEEGVGALFAGSWPRVAKAILSGAIQFATYEETKQKMSQLFIRR
ncbi:hypothetical protein ACHAW5_004364 [Stephanodiscus triporus]|uniref:Mitochondrial carrier protein n=1 Tax=Stephanodiscus triporus TaxID=2934178 RepID=A0ABD3Q4A0_9STRA